MREESRITFKSIFRIKVRERASARLIGYVGDLSERGMKVITDEAVEVGTEVHWQLRMRKGDGSMLSVDVDGHCLWQALNAKNGHIEAGIRIGQPSAEYTQLVESLRSRRK